MEVVKVFKTVYCLITSHWWDTHVSYTNKSVFKRGFFYITCEQHSREDSSGERARLAGVGQIHTPVNQQSFKATAGLAQALLGQRRLQNVSITPSTPTSAGLNSSQDETQSVLSQVLQTIFMPCWIWLMFVYTPRVIPSPSNGAQIVPSFHCVAEQ